TKKFKTRDEQRWIDDYTTDPERRRVFYEAILAERRRHPDLVDAADIVDLSALFDDRQDAVYIDLYHLSEAGNAAVAAAMHPIVEGAVGTLSRTACPAAQGF